MVASRDRHDQGAAARQREAQRVVHPHHWRVEGDNRLYWTSQKTYGWGPTRARVTRSTKKYDYYRFFERLYRQVGRDVYLGGEFLYSNHTDVRPGEDPATEAWPDSPYVAYSEQFGFDPASQSSAGFGLHALVRPARQRRSTPAGAGTRTPLPDALRGFLGGSSELASSWATT